MFFLDTNIIVDLIRNRRPNLRERYNAARMAGSPILVSTIVLFELHFGVANSNRPEHNQSVLNAFLADDIGVVAFDEIAAAEAGLIRAELSHAGALIGPYDILIAAQARAGRASLVTGNLREFDRVPGLIVTDWGA